MSGAGAAEARSGPAGAGPAAGLSGSDLEALYRETILDHSRRPRHGELAEPFTVEVHQRNPLCGDEVTLRLHLDEGGGHLAGLSHASHGCSVSVASTSVMASALVGRRVGEALAAYDAVHALVTGAGGERLDEIVTDEDDPLADAAAFAGVARYPARVKCALLGWAALRTALVEAGAGTD